MVIYQGCIIYYIRHYEAAQVFMLPWMSGNDFESIVQYYLL